MKKALGIVICLCILLCTFAVSANEPPNTISWDITGTTLTISGNGAMPDYRNESDVPWNDAKSKIEKIVVKDGITHIGNLAFYGLTNAKEAVIADSVKTTGLCAFSYTEGTMTTIGNPNVDYSFALTSDSSVVSEGAEFTASITLTADFKNLLSVQAILLFDPERISINEENWYDEDWYNSVNKTNLGYISSPLSGIVANNLRLLYLSTAGTMIDESSPLYNMGRQTITVAKVKCKALTDIEDINASCLAIKSCVVMVSDTEGPRVGTCSETQLTNTTRLPIKNLVINGKANASTSTKLPTQKEENTPVYTELTVVADGKEVAYDVNPFENEDGVLMLPLRYTLEAMGASVTWDNQTSTAFVIYGGDLVAVQIGRNVLFKNDETVTLKAPASVSDGRTMVSYDCIESAFGFSVDYNKNSKLIKVSSK